MTAERGTEVDLKIIISATMYVFPFSIYLIFYILFPGDILKKADNELIKVLIEQSQALTEVSDRNSIIELLSQIQAQEMSFVILKHLRFDKLSLVYVFAEISSWLFISIQFELDSQK